MLSLTWLRSGRPNRISVRPRNGLGVFWDSAYSIGITWETWLPAPTGSTGDWSTSLLLLEKWMTIEPPAMTVLADVVSLAPSWLSYTTPPLVLSVILMRNLSVPPPPFI